MAFSERLVIAIEKNDSRDNNSMEGLWGNMKALSCFALDFLAHYVANLVDNPCFLHSRCWIKMGDGLGC
jgi:hypothetical protein